MTEARDVRSLSEPHRRFWQEARSLLPDDRLLCDPLRTVAYGTDASFYRLVPAVVARARDVEEVRGLLGAAARNRVPVTFRAAGTSLSGQAITDSVLVQLSGWKGMRLLDGAARVALEPGVVGAEANALLLPHGRKIGPDPASIGACMVGGIVANNSSGMCCGTSQNSYRTVESMKLVLADGALLDTGDPASRRAFAASHRELLERISSLRDEVAADPALADRIRHKYRIKNTTGYGLNSFLDFRDPIDILLHLAVGSEGTLAFIAEVVLRTVEEHPHKASALLLFPDIEQAARATQRLKASPVSAVELMDRASLRSVESRPGMPPALRSLGPDACALLVEVRGASPEAVAERARAAAGAIAGIPVLEPAAFTAEKAEFERLWDVRRGLFPAVGSVRRIGTTVVIEDVAFPMEHLAAGTVELQRLFGRHGYSEGIIFGHALDGNLHFVFTQDFGDPAEVERYRRFLEDVCDLVVRKYDGSLKGEHGTGRNMAPFVEREWGEKAYGIMKRVKALLDPLGILNPGVVLNGDPLVHLANLKSLPRAHEVVDRCIECGFCEPRCPSRNLTLTPRQRIAVRREMARLGASGDGERLRRLARDYAWQGDETCATCGLCATACPVSIDTGKMTKALRAEGRGRLGRGVAAALAGHYAGATRAARAGLAAADAGRAVLGGRLMRGLASGARALSGGRTPAWHQAFPRPSPPGPFADRVQGRSRRLVYLPACTVRTMGPARGDPDPRAEFEAVLSLLDRGGWDVVFPRQGESLCCGLTFDSKGFADQALAKARELERELLAASQGGALPVLCDTSPCLQRMRAVLDPRLRTFEPVEFIHDFLLPELPLERLPGKVALHLTCSAQKLGLEAKLRAVAAACAEEVVLPATGCCGFAGDKGFTAPELNASALSGLREAVAGCAAGYSNSRTCQIGLSLHAGIPYQSIVHLVDRCAARAAAPREAPGAGAGPAHPPRPI
jgi:D-lactate dehydrogenase